MRRARRSGRLTVARQAPTKAAPAPRFIGTEIYRRSSYGGRHPLAIPRVSTCIDLCRALGWLPEDDAIRDADRRGLSLLDIPESPFIRAVARCLSRNGFFESPSHRRNR